MKRILIIFSCLLLFTLLFSGCGSKKQEKQPESESVQQQETTTIAETTQAETTTADNNDSEEAYFTGYSIWVNLAYCCVTVYECYSDDSKYPIRSMACSCGRAGQETPEGVFYTSDKFDWGYMADGSWAAYVTRFNGDILFHSVPSWEPAPGNIEIGEYNKLGGPASLGCIRLCVADASWIYNNMPWGTEVVVYTDYESPGPWGFPETYKVPDDIPQVCQWDPTDPDPGNPWPYYTMTISPDVVNLPAGSTADDLYNQISITDNYGNSVKHYAAIYSDSVDFSTAGSYDVYINITLGSSYSEKSITVNISE